MLEKVSRLISKQEMKTKSVSSLLTLFVFVAVAFYACVAVDLSHEEKCIESIPTSIWAPADIIVATMRRGLWLCAKEVVEYSQKQDGVLDLRVQFETEQRNIAKEITSLKSVIESSLPMPNVSPAFQWAQSPTEILLNIKFSHKLDAPATLNVEANNVTILSNRLILQASDGRKNFNLNLELLKSIVPEESKYDMASVGRMTFTLKKADGPARWARLLKSKKKVAHMHMWWEMQEKYNSELNKINDDDDDDESSSKSSKENKSKGKASSATSNSTTPTDGDNSTDGSASTESSSEGASAASLALQEKLKKIDEFTKAKLQSAEEAGKKRKAEVDAKAREEKKKIDSDVLAQKQVIEMQAEDEKKAATAEVAAENKNKNSNPSSSDGSSSSSTSSSTRTDL